LRGIVPFALNECVVILHQAQRAEQCISMSSFGATVSRVSWRLLSNATLASLDMTHGVVTTGDECFI